MSATTVSNLGEAWAEAEAALPDGWCALSLYHYDTRPDEHTPGHYGAKAFGPDFDDATDHGAVYGYGATPEAALRALAAEFIPEDDPHYQHEPTVTMA